MAKITLNSGKYTVVMDDVDKSDPDKWKVVEQQNYRPDKGKFMLERFRKDFSKQAAGVPTIEKLTSLASRSKVIGDWYARTSAEYVLIVSAPQYLEGIIGPKDYSVAQESIQELNKNASNKSLEQQAAVKDYQARMDEIDVKYNKLNSKLLKDKVVKILTLNSTVLPITLQLMIENYTASTTSSSPDKKTYGREILTQYKISLLKYFTEPANANVDIDQFISEMSEK